MLYLYKKLLVFVLTRSLQNLLCEVDTTFTLSPAISLLLSRYTVADGPNARGTRLKRTRHMRYGMSSSF